MARPFARVASLGLLLVACGGSQTSGDTTSRSEGPITVAEEDLPVGATISEAYRFAISPGPRWRVAREEELAFFGTAAAAGAVRHDGSGFGSVVVESMPGIDLERAAELTFNAFPGEGKRLESQDPITFLGYPALRQVITATVEGTFVRWTNIVFLHQGHLYRLSVWGSELEARDREGFFASFALLEGQVRRPPREAVQEAVGADWHVHGGVFESLSANLRMRSGAGWRVVVEDELHEMHAGAAAGMVHAEPDVYAIVLTERVPEARYEAIAAHTLGSTRQNLGGQTYGTTTVPFAGADLELTRMRANGFEYLHGVQCTGGRCRQLLVWYVQDSAEAAARALASMPPVEDLDEASQRTLREALTASRRARRITGAGYAYRGASYVDFTRGLTLRAPAGSFWDITRESEVESSAELHFIDRVHGLNGLFVTEALRPGVSGAEYHREVQAAIGLPQAPARAVRLGGSPGHESTAPRAMPFGEFQFRVFTTVIADRGYRFVFWGWPSHLEAASDAVEALIAQATLHGGPIPPYAVEGERLVDQRFGIALRPPPGWEYADFTDPGSRGISVVHGFVYPDGTIVQLLASRSRGTERTMREEVARAMIGRLRERVGVQARPQQSDTTLAGREATLVRWQGAPIPIEMRVTAMGQVVYGLVVIGRRDAEAIAQSLELLD